MKKYIHLLLLNLLIIVFTSCSNNDNNINDPIFEFVAFEKFNVSLDEVGNTETPFETKAKLLVFKPFETETEITFKVKGVNCEEGVDFTVQPESGKLVIKPGEYLSNSLKIFTIDNEEQNDKRTIEVEITGINQPDIKIGLGLTDIKGNKIIASIVDDDIIASGIQIFEGSLNCSSIGSNGYGGTSLTTATLNGNDITIKGNLINYSTFPDQTMTLTFVPDNAEATSGMIKFNNQVVGVDKDGYQYQYRPTDNKGTYDAEDGVIRFSLYIYYESKGNWTYWYEDELLIEVP
ncbi:MAG: hypothetical protein PHS04_05995 [Tissierellia bacterium]|jgi:hypothetical protein|nr:hypothetical protein [Tissierellia bacterium]